MLKATIGAGYALSGYSAATAAARAARDSEDSGDVGLVAVFVGDRLGHRHEHAAAHGQAQAGDEDPLLVVVDAVEDRHAREPPGGQRRPDRLGEDLAVDDARDGSGREVVESTRSATGTWRRQSAVWSGQPTLAAKVSPKASACASGCWLSANAPLSTIARWNSPRDPRETRWASTETPPADWPAIVTSCGSPPNCRDVVLDPAQRRLLVHQPVVAGRTARAARPAPGARGSRARPADS